MVLKVALVVPSTDIKLSKSVPPLNLASLASYIRKIHPQVQVKIFDGSITNPIAPLVLEYNPDVIGVTAVTPQAPSAYKLLTYLKENLPNSLTVIGGVHATQLPEEAAKYVDCVVVGEGEVVITEIIQNKIENKYPPKIIKGKPLEDLDEIPSPAFDLLDMPEYLKSEPSVPNLTSPTFGIVTSRGCPYRCRFCWNSARAAKVTYFSAQRIIKDIMFLNEKYGVNSIFFNDDEFLINTKRIKELSTLFKQYGIAKWLKWGCQARARTVNAELLKTIKEMGCVAISIGMESACPKTLDYLKNGSATVEDNQKALEIAHSYGITMGGSFILGTPNETLKEMYQTANFCWSNPKLKYFGFGVLTPYPNTEVWKDCINMKLIDENIDYELLIPPQNPSETQVLVTTIPHKVFMAHYSAICKMTWLSLAVRKKPSAKTFFRTSYTPTWWYLWFKYPKVMGKTFKIALKRGK
jgi:anaerobic magnesium-protoporphyrin IX monomethyl ester cyclase